MIWVAVLGIIAAVICVKWILEDLLDSRTTPPAVCIVLLAVTTGIGLMCLNAGVRSLL